MGRYASNWVKLLGPAPPLSTTEAIMDYETEDEQRLQQERDDWMYWDWYTQDEQVADAT